jgi:hypothetical protein
MIRTARSTSSRLVARRPFESRGCPRARPACARPAARRGSSPSAASARCRRRPGRAGRLPLVDRQPALQTRRREVAQLIEAHDSTIPSRSRTRCVVRPPPRRDLRAPHTRCRCEAWMRHGAPHLCGTTRGPKKVREGPQERRGQADRDNPPARPIRWAAFCPPWDVVLRLCDETPSLARNTTTALRTLQHRLVRASRASNRRLRAQPYDLAVVSRRPT